MGAILSGSICLGSFIGLFYVNRSLNDEKNRFHLVEKSSNMSPMEINEYFQNKMNEMSVMNCEKPKELTLYAFAEGIVRCAKPFISLINKQSKLIYSYYYKENIHSNDYLIPQLELKKMKKKENPIINTVYDFNIVDAINPAYKCNVHRNYEVDATDGMELIAWEKRLKELKWYEKFISLLALIMEILGSYSKSAFHVRGIKIGWIKNELGIKVDSPIIAFGELIYDLKNNTMVMKKPLYFLKDKILLIKKLKLSVLGKRVEYWVLMMIFVISGYVFIKKQINRYIQRKNEQRLNEDSNKLKRNFDKVIDSGDCLLCKKNPSEIVASPCSHMCLCRFCYQAMKKKTCPSCSKKITEATQIYLS